MKSPFPGMDPYLEDAATWPDVHHRLITCSCDQLQERLNGRYVATIGERLYLEQAHRTVLPDLGIRESGWGTGSRTALVVADEPVVIVSQPDEVREPLIEIRDLSAGERVVTIIEVLSPFNKRKGEGHKQYVDKQRAILHSDVHMVEIDLLRGGEPTAALSREEHEKSAYRVLVHRAPNRSRRGLYRFGLRERLPRLGVPLVSPDPDVVLDLQRAFEEAYQRGAYGRRVDYSTAPPDPPLGDADREWAASVASASRTGPS